MQQVRSTCTRDPTLFYGASCMPTVKGLMWECASKEEYLALREAYESCEQSCNMCKHLQRTKHEKCVFGYLQGICGKTGDSIRFHPEDPQDHPCWESRRV